MYVNKFYSLDFYFCNINECFKRRIDNLCVVIYNIKKEINIKEVDYLEKNIYTLVGIDTKVYRQIIYVY